MRPVHQHPDAAELERFARGDLGDEALSAVETHLTGCAACRTHADAAGDDGFVELLRRAHTRSGSLCGRAAETILPVCTPTPGTTDSVLPSRPRAAAPDAPEGSCPAALADHPRYRVRRLIGRGGMGAVYEAEHRLMSRSVALKVINPAFTASAAAVERFRREVRAAARLSHHENVAAALDAEEAQGTHFLVMEFVAGASLARVVKEGGPLPVADACDAVRQAALGLQHAHEHGLVHRDVKPDNLLRCADGRIKVVDFGLAALASERGDGLTDDRAVMGTPEFMAPEQAEDARRADARSDVYSLGCTLFYLLTGRVPYPAPTSVLKLLAHREQPVPDLAPFRSDVPGGLVRVLNRLLAKRPEGRYATPGAVAAALLPFARPEPVAAVAPARPQRRHRFLVALAAVLLLGGGAAGVVHRIQTDRGELVVTTESDDVEVTVKRGGEVVEIIDTKTKKKVTLKSGVYDLELKGGEGLGLDIEKATLTRGGVVVARIERRPAANNPETKPVVLEPVALLQYRHGHRFFCADISPDGRHVLAIRAGYGALRVWEVETGKLVHEWGGDHTKNSMLVAHFTPDSKQVVACKGSGEFWVFDLASGKEVRKFQVTPTNEGVWDFWMSLTGTRLMLVERKSGQVWDWSAGKKLCDFPWNDSTPTVMSPDGSYLFQTDGPKPPSRVIDTNTGKVVNRFRELRDIRPRWFTLDMKHVGSEVGPKWNIHDTATGRVVRSHELEEPTGDWALNVDFERGIAFDFRSKDARVIDVRTGELLYRLRLPAAPQEDWRRCWSLDSGHCAIVSPAGEISVYRIPAARPNDRR